jgi:hypothetical protein
MAYKVKMKITRIRQRVIQSRESVERQRCQWCKREVEMLTSIEAATILEVDQQTLAGLISEGRVHAIESVSGNIWLCKESLLFPIEEGDELPNPTAILKGERS